MERTSYRFDILSDYGAFRDLQRHRMLTIEWQRLSTQHGYVTPDAIADIGATAAWEEVMERTATLADHIDRAHGPVTAQYAVPFAYRIRYYIDMNAREAFHLLELRSQSSGHPGYRAIAQDMHRLIRDEAGHHAIADAMQFVDHDDYDLARLEEERRLAARRAARGVRDE
jgi:thymidylate synthase ThyX